MVCNIFQNIRMKYSHRVSNLVIEHTMKWGQLSPPDGWRTSGPSTQAQKRRRAVGHSLLENLGALGIH